jgi:hypothetical protein
VELEREEAIPRVQAKEDDALDWMMTIAVIRSGCL